MSTNSNKAVEKVIKIKDLKPAKYNPRKIKDEEFKRLVVSIEENGVLENIVVNKDMTIISGHQRLKACRELEIRSLKANIVDLSKDEERALNIALNKIRGEFDDTKLAELLAKMKEQYHYKTGLGEKDITRLLDKLANQDPEDGFEPELPKNPKSKMGDIYQLGEHRLMCGSATNKKDVDKLMNGEKAQMVFTDPPYNVDYTGGMGTHEKNNREGILNDKMSDNEFYLFLQDCIENMISNCDGGIYICMSSTELTNLKRAFEVKGGHFQSFIIWAKNTFTLSRADWQNQYEPILYGWGKHVKKHYFVGHRDEGNVWRNIETLKPQVDKDGKMTIKLGEYHIKLDKVVNGEICVKRECTDIWSEKKPTKSSLHPTMKPIKLVQKAIRASSKRKGIVLDLFGGSGSTMIASHKLNRRCYTMELDPQYVDVIIKRWELLTNMKAKKIKK